MNRTLNLFSGTVPIRESSQSIAILAVIVGLGACAPEPSVEPGLQKAEDHLSRGEPQLAVDVLEDLRESFPEDARVLESLAFAYAEADRPELAAFAFTELGRSSPEQAPFLLFAARLHAGENRPEEAIRRYDEYLDQRDDDPTAWKSLGEIQLEIGSPLDAIRAFSRSYNLRNNPELALQLGQLFFARSNFPQAETWWEQARETANGPQRRDALIGLAQVAVVQREFSVAEAHVTTLREEFPEAFADDTLRDLGNQIAEWRRRQEALAATLEEDPLLPSPTAAPLLEEPPVEQPLATASPTEDPAPTVTITEVPEPASDVSVVDEEPVETPAAALVPAEADPPVSSEALPAVDQARALMARGNPTAATELLWATLNEDDSDPALWTLLSEAYLAIPNGQFAEVAALEAARRAPNDPAVARQLLRALQVTRPPSEYLAEVARTRLRFADDPDFALLYARALTRAGSTTEAALQYNEFLNLAPDSHPDRAAALAELRSL